jgi:hypothetical protein
MHPRTLFSSSRRCLSLYLCASFDRISLRAIVGDETREMEHCTADPNHPMTHERAITITMRGWPQLESFGKESEGLCGIKELRWHEIQRED